MSLRDQSVSLTARETDTLNALRKDRDDSGPGLHPWEIERLDNTVYPHRTIDRLREHGFVIGVYGGLFQLGHEDPDAESGTVEGSESGGSPTAPSSDRLTPPAALSAEQLPIPDQPRKARPHFQDAA